MALSRTDISDGLVDELQAFEQLVRSLTPAELDSPSRCAGWTVGDVAVRRASAHRHLRRLSPRGQAPNLRCNRKFRAWPRLPHVMGTPVMVTGECSV